MKNKIVNKIKEFRIAKGMTQEELAKAVGVSRQSIISIERGRHTPSLALALQLALFFGCPTDALFQRKEKGRDR